MRQRVAVADLTPHPQNPRTISPARFRALCASLTADPAMMEARPILALPDGTVIGGNMRLRAAIELGWSDVPVVTVDLSPGEALEWAIRDNVSYGEWDERALARLVTELERAGAPVDLTGLEPETVARLLAGTVPTADRVSGNDRDADDDGHGETYTPAAALLIIGPLVIRLDQAAVKEWEAAAYEAVGFAPEDITARLLTQLEL